MNGLLYARQTFGYSLQMLAERLGVSNQMISMWERGKKSISAKRLQELSALFSIPEDYFQKELNSAEEYAVQISRLEKHIDESTVEIEEEIYDRSTGKFISVPQVYYDKGTIEHLEYTKLERRIEELKQRLTSCIHNVEKQGYAPDDQFSGYNSYLEDNIRLMESMIDIADRADLAPHFLRHVLKAITLLNRDCSQLEDGHKTTKQVYAVLNKCYQEEKAHADEVIGEHNRMVKLIDELADNDLY